jgi:hypothetical protein
MKKVILILGAVATMVSCNGQRKTANNNASIIIQEDENMKTEEIIWTTMNVWKKADPEQGKFGSYEETHFVFLGYDFVKNCPIEIKTIIAFFSKMYISEEPFFSKNDISKQKIRLANALGGFSTLEEAQQALLKDKEHYFKDIQKEKYILRLMEIETDKNIVSVTLNFGTYKFKILENGDIEYLPQEK